MDEREMERRLGEFDFSRISPVREPLLQKLLFLRRSKEGIAEKSKNPWENRIDDEALDFLAAAGNPVVMEKPRDKK